MKKLKKFGYYLETISSMPLSPRAQKARYAGIDFDSEKISKQDGKNINIIYPFYQYGEYHSEQPEYYIPGSSIKGAMKRELRDDFGRFMVDDIPVQSEDIELRQLYKVQNLPEQREMKENPEDRKQIMLELFFPQMAIQMLRCGISYKGEIYAEEGLDIFLEEIQDGTKEKLKQFIYSLDRILENVHKNPKNVKREKSCLEELEEARNGVQSLLETCKQNEALLLMGGYKGLLLSELFSYGDSPDAMLKGAIYLDKECNLPHGIVKIRLGEEYV